MSRDDLKKMLSSRTGCSQKLVDSVVQDLIGLISDRLALGETVHIPGLGRFAVRARGPRTYRHPRTGEVRQAAESAQIQFKPEVGLRRFVSEKQVLLQEEQDA